MQTERVTFLTTPENKAALDAFAASSGHSVGHVLREASMRYVAEGDARDEDALELLVREVNRAVPQMRADIQEAIAAIERSSDRTVRSIRSLPGKALVGERNQ